MIPGPSVFPSHQAQRLLDALNYSASHVLHYRNLFLENGLRPSNIGTIQDLQTLPILHKYQIQENWSNFISDEYRDREAELHIRYTSGSSGQPLKVIKTRTERIIAGRYLMQARQRCGLSLTGIKSASLGGRADFDSHAGDNPYTHGRGKGKILRLSYQKFSELAFREYVTALNNFQPTWLYALPSTIEGLARLSLEEKLMIDLPNLQLIELAGEFLSPDVRKCVQEAFKLKPISQYSAHEVWGIAFECMQGSMHVLEENVLLEVLRDDGTPVEFGEAGQTIVTSLNFRCMPFIRYQLGDLVTPLDIKCACGDSRPVVRIEGGRSSDLIHGHPTKIGNLIFDAVMKRLHETYNLSVQQYRIVQKSTTTFEAWIVDKNLWTTQLQGAFVSEVRHMLNQQVKIVFKFVPHIPEHPSGKKKSFIVQMEEVKEMGSNEHE